MSADLYDINGNTLSNIFDILGNIIRDNVGRYKTFSVLADSYGAFEGYTDPGTNAYYYPSNDVTEYTQMWWYLFGNSYGCTLDKCNAFSGSRVANDPEWFQGVEQCYIARSDNLGNPDLILILGGTNDVWNGITIGSPVYEGWTDENKQEFYGACAYLIAHIKTVYPSAHIIWMCNTRAISADSNLSSNQYYLALHEVCDHYSVPCLDIAPEITGNHPTAHGMEQIRNDLMIHLEEEPNIVRELPMTLSMPANITWSPDANNFTVDHIEQGKLYKVDINVTDIGGSDSYVNVSSTGTTTAAFAKFDAYKGQNGKMSVIVEASQYANGENIKISLSVTGTTRTATISELHIYEVSY